MGDKLTFKQKLQKVQVELKAPKNLYNSFGKYKYRNAEGICEAVKPYLNELGLFLTMSDDVILMADRFYIKATVTISDIDSESSLSVQALARESFDKKGMDDSQITGTASSYARKYALNGLFLLDDTKDADTDEYHDETNKKTDKPKLISKEMLEELQKLCVQAKREESYIAKSMNVEKLTDLPLDKFAKTKAGLLTIINKNNENKGDK